MGEDRRGAFEMAIDHHPASRTACRHGARWMCRDVSDFAQIRGPLVRHDSTCGLPLPSAQVALTIPTPQDLVLVCKQGKDWGLVNVHDSRAFRRVHDQFARRVSSDDHALPEGQCIEWRAVMRQGLAVFLTVFPSCQHAVATRGNPAPCGFVPRQVVHRTLMAAKDEGGSAWNHGAKVTLGAKEFVCMLPSCK